MMIEHDLEQYRLSDEQLRELDEGIGVTRQGMFCI
jgi:hypothetical protein